MKKAIAITSMLAALLGTAVFTYAAKTGPKFAEYSTLVYAGKKAAIRMDTVSAINVGRIKNDLKRGYNAPVNFAGHYVFIVLTAGDDCETAAVIDVTTGKVTELDVAACHWRENDTTPFHFRPNSKLLVLSGSVGWDGERSAHYYIFENGKFSPLEGIQHRRYPTSKHPPLEDASDQALAFQLGKQGMMLQEQMENGGEGALLENDNDTTLPLYESSEGIRALSRAFLFAFHRPLINKEWRDKKEEVDIKNLNVFSEYFIKSSIIFPHTGQSSKSYLLFNPGSDLFAILEKSSDGDISYGIMTMEMYAEKLLGLHYGDNYIDNMVNYRPKFLKAAVTEFNANYETVRDNFDLYKMDEASSLEVFDTLKAYMHFSSLDAGNQCRNVLIDKVNGMKFAFPDGAAAASVGNFYGTTVIPMMTPGKHEIRNALAFHDKRTSRYGGFVLFDPVKNCNIDAVIPANF